MNANHLQQGLLGLSRTLDCGLADDHTGRNWFSGHWPCAVLAACSFCADNPLQPGAEAAVTHEVDRLLARFPTLFDASAESAAGPTDGATDTIAAALDGSIDRYMVSGHNVIYAAYAMQTLADHPELAAPAVVAGLVALVGYFTERNDGLAQPAAADAPLITYADSSDMVEHVLTALRCAPRLTDRRRLLFDGHLITHAHALVTLERCGYADLARRGLRAHAVHAAQSIELQSQHLVDRWTEKVTVTDHPLSPAFWQRDFDRYQRQWEYGHVFKYLHSFYALAEHCRSPEELCACERQLAYLI